MAFETLQKEAQSNVHLTMYTCKQEQTRNTSARKIYRECGTHQVAFLLFALLDTDSVHSRGAIGQKQFKLRDEACRHDMFGRNLPAIVTDWDAASHRIW